MLCVLKMYLRARSKEQIDERKKTIIQAMDKLYMEKELASIYLKDIAELANISRTAIYSYYSRKEEILLDSLYNHFILLDNKLETLSNVVLSKEKLINEIANSLVENIIILKIMSTNLEDIERSTTLENLVILKNELKRFQTLLQNILKNNFKNTNDTIIKNIMYCFITMLYGYYPITKPIEVQKEAMEITNTTINISLSDLIKTSLNFLFSNLN